MTTETSAFAELMTRYQTFRAKMAHLPEPEFHAWFTSRLVDDGILPAAALAGARATA